VSDIISGGKIGWKLEDGIKILNATPVVTKLSLIPSIFNIITVFLTSWVPFTVIRPQVVIISVPPGESSFLTFILAKLFRIKKVVIDFRDEWEDFAIQRSSSKVQRILYKFLKSLMTRCYIHSDLVITTTGSMKNGLLQRGIKNVKIVPNGADIDIFKPQPNSKKILLREKLGLTSDDFVIVYSGMIGGYYKIDIVIRAIKKLRARIPCIKFILIGNGPDLNHVLDLAKELELENVVRYLGEKIDKHEISDIISICNLGVMPYDKNSLWKHTLPVKAFEYFACGLPIAATTYEDSELGRLILEQEVGMIAKPENENELFNIIEKMFFDNDFLKNAGERAYCLIKNRYDRNKIAEGLAEAIEDIK